MCLRVCSTNIFFALAVAAVAAVAQSAAAQVENDSPDAADKVDNPAGHGEISIDYFDSYANDFFLRSNLKVSSVLGVPFGTVHLQGTGLDGSYNVSSEWTVYGGIRYFTGRYSGPLPNCPTTAPPQCAGFPPLTPPQPASPFIDDGKYHGAWQDWHLGVRWNADINNYDITPSAIAYIPTHHYPTFGNAVVGQDLRQLLLGVQLKHQFDFTNLYYRLGYGYAFSEHVQGFNTGYQRADIELGWFVTEKFSIDTFVTGRAGFGSRASLGQTIFDTDFFKRQQFAQHDYHAVGVGTGYDINDRYSVSADIQHEYWGDTVYDFKYALELYLTRKF